jgi:outer membrane lipopolysaccharide assembly protein LptE/RlpB
LRKAKRQAKATFDAQWSLVVIKVVKGQLHQNIQVVVTTSLHTDEITLNLGVASINQQQAKVTTRSRMQQNDLVPSGTMSVAVANVASNVAPPSSL